jgi:hypothetical protein
LADSITTTSEFRISLHASEAEETNIAMITNDEAISTEEADVLKSVIVAGSKKAPPKSPRG